MKQRPDERITYSVIFGLGVKTPPKYMKKSK